MEDNSIEKCHLLSLQFFLELLSTKVILPMKTDDRIFCGTARVTDAVPGKRWCYWIFVGLWKPQKIFFKLPLYWGEGKCLRTLPDPTKTICMTRIPLEVGEDICVNSAFKTLKKVPVKKRKPQNVGFFPQELKPSFCLWVLLMSKSIGRGPVLFSEAANSRKSSMENNLPYHTLKWAPIQQSKHTKLGSSVEVVLHMK